MNKEKLEDFDKFAHEYKEILDKTLEYGGEKWEYFIKYKTDFISRCVGKGFSGKVLDYGCGIGMLSEVLLKQFPQASIDGFDVSEASIEHVGAHLKEQGLFTSDTGHLRRDYDLIVIANVLHHVEPADRKELISKLNGLIKDEGRIIIFEHNPYNPITCEIVRNCPLDKGVVLLPSSETLLYLRNIGFENIQLNYIVFFPKFLSVMRWAERFLSWLPLGAQYACIGQVKKYA